MRNFEKAENTKRKNDKMKKVRREESANIIPVFVGFAWFHVKEKATEKN